MCRTSAPPRREIYELTTELGARKVPSFLPKGGRRWTYQGTEEHYGYTYHLWQNELTQRKYAWEVETYRNATINGEARLADARS